MSTLGRSNEREWATNGSLGPSFTRRLAAIVVLGLLARLAIALVSIGTNDVLIWQAFGRSAAHEGFAQLWLTKPWMNHPPLPVVWARTAYVLTGQSLYAFSLLIKTPGIVADVASIALVGRIVVARTGDARAALIAATLLALNPTSLLVSGYHGNTDPTLGALVLLTWWLASRGRLGWAALALGLSMNVKLTPGPTIIVLLALVQNRRQLARVVGALAVGAVPFVIMTCLDGATFLHQTVGYRPWVFGWLSDGIWRLRNLSHVGPAMMFVGETLYKTQAEASLLIACGVALLASRRRDRFDPLTLGALFWTAFTFWNGGGGCQYAIWPIALLTAVRPRLAFLYGSAAGVWLAWAYVAVRVPGQFPFESLFALDSTDVFSRAAILPLAASLIATVSLLRAKTGEPRCHAT